MHIFIKLIKICFENITEKIRISERSNRKCFQKLSECAMLLQIFLKFYLNFTALKPKRNDQNLNLIKYCTLDYQLYV